MNIRLILVLLVVTVFAIGSGTISFVSGSGITLNQAYNDKNVEITQNTAAGTIPHTVTLKNNGTRPVVVDKGVILKNDSSQDLVIIENKKINAGTSDTINAYCLEPEQTAIPGSKLTPSNMVSSDIMEIIDSSNPSNLSNATKSQLQIWIVVDKGEVNASTGEAAAVVRTQKIRFNQMRQNLTAARNDVIKRFNLTPEGLQKLESTSESNTGNIPGISNFLTWLQSSLGI
jgi:ARG and Rhodanese-Phosphatase-superfamily-associated Protein domain